MKHHLLFKLALLIICLSLISCKISGKKEPIAKNGILDLSDWDFRENGAVNLNGEWEYYWEQLLTPTDLNAKSKASHRNWFEVPNAWNGYQLDGKSLPQNGYATYKLTVKTDRPVEKFGLKISRIDTAYQLWVNGEKVAFSGVVGKRPESTEAMVKPQICFFSSIDGQLQIVIQASDFVWHKGGLIEPLKLGTDTQILQKWQWQIGYELFLAGSILIMSLYHFGLFFQRKQDRFNFYFGAFCLLVSLRLLTSGTHFLGSLFPVLYPWETTRNLALLSIFLAFPSLYSFIAALYQNDINPLLAKIFQATGIIFTLITIIVPGTFSWPLLPIYLLLIVIGCIYLGFRLYGIFKKKETNVGWFIAGFAVLFLAILNDILNSFGVVHTRNLLSLGLFVFIFSQAFLLSISYSNAFSNIEHLSIENERINNELKEYNISLEKEVNSRTRELHQSLESAEKAKKMAVQANNFKTKFLGNISHELRTPMQGIIGFSKLGLSNGGHLSKQKIVEYFDNIYVSSKRLMGLLNNILDLSKLESGKMDYQFREVALSPLVTSVLKEFSAIINEKKIIVNFTQYELAKKNLMDTEKITQVLRNLISNAIKFSKYGGELKLQIGEQQNYLTFSITDNGIGIYENELKSVFNKFIQSSKTRTNAGGTGLGLAICKEIILGHQGSIWAENNPEGGSIFKFKIPFHSA